MSTGYRIDQLNRFVPGWLGYFRLSMTPDKFAKIDQWFRRRLRQVHWKEWKLPRTRVANLRDLNDATSPILHRALPTQY